MPVNPSAYFIQAFACISILAACGPAMAESAYRSEVPLTQAQSALPASGPASFWFNPAVLAETHWASVGYGHAGSVSGKAGSGLRSMTGALPIESFPRWPVGFALGYASRGAEYVADGANAVYVEGESRLSTSICLPAAPDRRFLVSAGAAWTTVAFNVFNALRSTSHGIDFGLYASFPGAGGTVRAGTTLHHFLRPEARLPEDNPALIKGHYNLRQWWQQDAGWTSADDCWRADLGLFLLGPHDLAEGPDQDQAIGVNGWELEARPIPLIGIRLERPRIGAQSTFSFIAYPTLPRVGRLAAFAAVGFGHDKYDPQAWLPLGAFTRTVFGEARDEGRGYLLTVAIGASI